MAIVTKGFRCGVTASYDNSDSYESRVEELGHINPSLEFWLFNNASSIDNALIVGAGFGLSSKQLINGGATVTSIEPSSSRFSLLESNAPTSTNINKMCGSSSGTAVLNFFSDNKSGGSMNSGFGDASETVDVITVDSLDLTLDLMLVYANGREIDVLDGAVDTIANNPGMKIILRWEPDKIENVQSAIASLNALNKTIKIIHWEKVGDVISYKDTDDTILEAVITADLLLE